jgi:lipopolysaccharide transport protein LptA
MMIFSKVWKLSAAACVLSVAAWAQQTSQQDLNMEVKGFRVPDYDGKGVMTSQLFGEHAEMKGGGEIRIDGMRIEFYKEGKTAMTVTSPYCFYNQKTREAHSDAPVAADMERMKMTGRGFLLISSNSTVRVFDDSRVTIKDAAKAMAGKAAGTVATNGVVATNTETVITSKELFLDYKARKARFEKNVHVKDSKMEMFCDELEIQSGQDNQINWIGASNGVRILNEGREALAGKATYDVKTDEIVMKDNPRVIDGKNMLVGEKIIFWRSNKRMVCEPSAHMVVYSEKKYKTDIFGK